MSAHAGVWIRSRSDLMMTNFTTKENKVLLFWRKPKPGDGSEKLRWIKIAYAFNLRINLVIVRRSSCADLQLRVSPS